jgi:glycine/D-amino acid oxidase-like deaminating enzyme
MSLNRHDDVIGACTAYFLSLRGIEVMVIERTEVAAAASGKAGGFLGGDWCADMGKGGGKIQGTQTYRPG